MTLTDIERAYLARLEGLAAYIESQPREADPIDTVVARSADNGKTYSSSSNALR
jgi:hypothetical protein